MLFESDMKTRTQDHPDSSNNSSVTADQEPNVAQLITRICQLPDDIRKELALKLLSSLDAQEITEIMEDCNTGQ